MANGTVSLIIRSAVAFALLLSAAGLAAKSADGTKQPPHNRYIVLLEDAPLAAHMAAARQSAPRSGAAAPRASAAERRLDVLAPDARAYLQELDSRFERFRGEFRSRMGRDLRAAHRYRFAVNGFSTTLSAAEAKQMSKMPGVLRVEKDRLHRLHTDSGPQWIGADVIWNGQSGITSALGEGVVIGVIDSGINWDHPAFQDQFAGGFNHTNPYGVELGLCSQAEVECNDKLVGVYDFVEDDPQTEEIEEFNNGFDNTNHGSLTASVVAGNPLLVTFNGKNMRPSGVAPNANIVTYRVCYTDDPDDSTDNFCQNSAIIEAIDQAVEDGVDVINYSIGSEAFSPWNDTVAIAFLNARASGIFVATSAGNSGPGESTLGSPGSAPWITAVGATTHDRVLASVLNANQGGDTTPPGTLYGTSLSTEAAGPVPIVHAKDFGNALCGTGEAELQPSCAENTGSTNPFPPGTFNGEIVVCDRGIYGRIEKGKNLLLAGAGGYVLANTSEQGEQTNSDEHCLASTHLGEADGDILREWLDSGTDHVASITGFAIVNLPEAGDRLSAFSSRGPNLPPVQDILKPNLVAPGEGILGAGNDGSGYVFANGTSFSSPHIAGAAALLRSVNPDLTPSMISSVLEMSSIDAFIVDETGKFANPHQRGAGRPQLGEAALSGLYLAETNLGFLQADPGVDGEPKTLNLPSMTDADCGTLCTFTRTLSPLQTGVLWSATVAGFPEGVVVNVTPDEFQIGSGGQTIQVEVDLRDSGVLNDWVYGRVVLSASGLPDANLTVAVFATGGIKTDADGGWQAVQLKDLPALPQATFRTGGLVKPRNTTAEIPEDPTFNNPYDGGAGVITELHEVPEDTLWLYAETLASEAVDLDLFVGFDSNGDGVAQASEEVCASTTPEDLERCDIFTPSAGTWWVLLQNWEDGFDSNGPEQEVTLLSAVVSEGSKSNLTATGPGKVDAGEAFGLRLSWENVNAIPGETLLGAVGIGTSKNSPNNVDVVPIKFNRNGIAAPSSLALFDGRPLGFALGEEQTHDRVFIDVPEGANLLDISVKGLNANQTSDLAVQIGHVDFDAAFSEAPFVLGFLEHTLPSPPTGSNVDVIPVLEDGRWKVQVSGNDLQPGRHYVVVRNNGPRAASITVRADLDFDEDQISYHAGLYEPTSRLDIKQGFEYNGGANSRALIWYTYTEDDVPVWYLSSGATQAGNVWTSDLFRFTNDGTEQVSTPVGSVAMTLISSQDVVFTWTLFGESGSDRTRPISAHQCAEIDGAPLSTTGLWYRGSDGLGGATVLMNAGFQAQVHYLYDDHGIPFWLFASAVAGLDEIPLLQWKGFCPICEGDASNEEVGVLGTSFTTETTGSWTLDYLLQPPLAGDVNRTDSIVKLTETLPCE